MAVHHYDILVLSYHLKKKESEELLGGAPQYHDRVAKNSFMGARQQVFLGGKARICNASV